MRISYWSSDVCSSDLHRPACDRRRLNGGHFFDTALIAMPAPRPPAPLASEVAVDNPCTIFPVRTPAQANAITQTVGSTMTIIAMTKFSTLSPKALFKPISGYKFLCDMSALNPPPQTEP